MDPEEKSQVESKPIAQEEIEAELTDSDLELVSGGRSVGGGTPVPAPLNPTGH